MKGLKLTEHFCKRYLERVGKWPTVEEVSHYIEESKRIQPCKNLKKLNGEPFRMLAIYFNKNLQLHFLIDTVERNAVTVIDEESV